jgi:hypothetical protein
MKGINHQKPCHPILMVTIAWSVLVFGYYASANQRADQLNPTDRVEPPSKVLEEQKSPDEGIKESSGYPPKERQIGTPLDVEWDMDQSFPKKDSLLELMLRTQDSQDQRN